MIRRALEHKAFQPASILDGRTAVPFIYKPGTSNVLFVLGENGSGKSFFRRVLHRDLHAQGVELVHWSIEARTNSPFAQLMYGSEREASTGFNSTKALQGGLRTAASRPSVLYCDEPDVGMSNALAKCSGEHFAKQLTEHWNPNIKSCCITSHSTHFLTPLLHGFDPHYLYLGDSEGPASIQEWLLEQQNPRTINLEDFQNKHRQRRSDISKLLRD